MISEMLREVRKDEIIFEKEIDKDTKPDFHLSSRVGWMNDPNGFSYYNGKYHMFYQYHPYNTNWGPMHWGHAVSEDLLHWEYIPVAIAPDQEYDKAGCFSGSALALPDGKHLLMYTGVDKEQNAAGDMIDIQTQCLAIGDGIDYVKYENNPVLNEKHLPKGASKIDFRDPKVWMGKDNVFYCVVGNRPEDGSGQILLFSSKDGFDWKFENVLIKNENRFGKMWECPDFFELDDKWILLTSPQDMLSEGMEYCSGNGTLCLIGKYNEDTKEFAEQYNQTIDYGVDFYAPQTVKTPDGRRIMIGWMQNWDTCCYRMENARWFGQMSIPRELYIQNNRLCQRPLREIEQLRRNEVSYQQVVFKDSLTLDGIKGRKIDMELELSSKDKNLSDRKFSVNLASNEKYYTKVSVDFEKEILSMDRSFAGVRKGIVNQRSCKVNLVNGIIKLRIIMDKFSIEVFVNDGEQVMTFSIYTDTNADNISFFANDYIEMNVLKYDLLC